MSTPSDAQRGADIALDLKHLLEQLKFRPRDVAAMRAWLQVHASDLNSIVASLDASRELLGMAAWVGNPDVMLALLEAGARPDATLDFYGMLLRYNAHIFDLNGDELDDASIADRLRRMRDVHGLRMPPYEFVTPATLKCVWHDRLECLRVTVEVDPQLRGYTEDYHDSLLHLAAWHCHPRIVEYLMQSGWSLTSHDLNDDGLSPLGTCLFAVPGADAEDVCAILSMLFRGAVDAAGVVRVSGLCYIDLTGTPTAASRGCAMPAPQRARMHIYVCAAVDAVSGLPWYVLGSNGYVRWLLENSPSILHSLPLDEHVTTAEGVVYLRDPLRLGGITTLPLAAIEHLDGHVVQVTEAVPVHALRFAVTVDALCAVEEVVCADASEEQWDGLKCMPLLRDSGVPMVTCVSTTLRHWAWMRRLHVLHARRRALRGMMARR